jgi:uncharacterized protein DUF1707
MNNEVVPAPEPNAPVPSSTMSDPHSHVRMSDRDRERVVARLNQAVSEGRLTIDEFTDRIDGVLAARTFGEAAPFVADLPQAPLASLPGDQATFTARGSHITRAGRWTVPSRVRIEALGSGVRLDFTRAIITTSVVHIDLKVHGSSVRLTVPPDCTVDLGSLSLHGSSAKCRKLATDPAPGSVHFVVSGEVHGSSVRAKPPRRWKWPWQKHTPLEIAGQ